MAAFAKSWRWPRQVLPWQLVQNSAGPSAGGPAGGSGDDFHKMLRQQQNEGRDSEGKIFGVDRERPIARMGYFCRRDFAVLEITAERSPHHPAHAKTARLATPAHTPWRAWLRLCGRGTAGAAPRGEETMAVFCEEPKREKSDAASDDKSDPAN